MWCSIICLPRLACRAAPRLAQPDLPHTSSISLAINGAETLRINAPGVSYGNDPLQRWEMFGCLSSLSAAASVVFQINGCRGCVGDDFHDWHSRRTRPVIANLTMGSDSCTKAPAYLVA